jgi:hypothetical protein
MASLSGLGRSSRGILPLVKLVRKMTDARAKLSARLGILPVVSASAAFWSEPNTVVHPLGERIPSLWAQVDDAALSATFSTPRSGKILLVAEGLPDGSWEWTMWKAFRPGEFLSGFTSTRAAACAAAELAAMEMAATNHSPPTRQKKGARGCQCDSRIALADIRENAG